MRIPGPALILAALLTPLPSAAQWNSTSGPGHAGIDAFLSWNGRIYAGTVSSGPYRTTDGGTTWSAANGGIPSHHILTLASNAVTMFAGAQPSPSGGGGIYRSFDQGQSWSPAGLNAMMIPSLYASGPLVLAGTIGSGPFRSTDDGATWNPANAGIGNQSVRAIVACNGVLFAAGDNNLYESTDAGQSWDFTNGGQYFPIFCMYVDGNSIYAGGHGGLVRSTDGGATFEGPIWIDVFPDLMRVTSFAAFGGDLYASVSGAPGIGVIRSADGGTTWGLANGGIPNVNVDALVAAGSDLLAGSIAKGLLRTADAGTHWSRWGSGLPAGTNIRCLRSSGGDVLAGTGGDGPYRTTDAGASWASISSEPTVRLAGEIVHDMLVNGSVWLAGTFASGVFRSTDAGQNWVQSNQGLPSGPYFSVLALQQSGTNVVAATSQGIFVSSNGGVSWTGSNVADDASSLAWEPGFTYAIVNTGLGATTGIYRSTDSGFAWSLVFPAGSMTPSVVAAGDGVVYMGDLLNGLLRSTNHGTSWMATSLDAAVFALLPVGATVYAGTNASAGGLSHSTDHGVTWSVYDDGLPGDASIEALVADGPFLYAGDDVRGVYRRIVDPAEVGSPPADAGLSLSMPRPDPFAREAVFDYVLPRSAGVRVDLIDVAGRRVRTLLDALQPAGVHQIRIDARGLAPGAYFCRLTQGGASVTRRVVRAPR